MILKLLTGPLIGMIIGYFTNWLAVRMLFRPRGTKYIAGKRIPFTPGVIPRGKERIAASMKDIINTQLLTEEVLRRHLTSEDMTESIRQSISGFLDELRRDQRTVREYLTQTAGEERLKNTTRKLQDLLVQKATEKIQGMNLGKIAAEIITEKMKDALADSFLGKMLGGSLTANLSIAVEKTVDQYIDEHGQEIIRDIIQDEKENFLNKTLSESITTLDNSGLLPEDQLVAFYTELAEKKSGSFLRKLDIGGIAQQTVRAMSCEELEHLVLSAIRTELQAVVNLGAVIGFLLGLFNLLIYII